MKSDEIDYLGLLKKSWYDFLNNKILFLPVLLAAIFVPLIFLAVLAIEALVVLSVFGAGSFELVVSELLTGFGIFLLIFFAIADIALVLLLTSYFGSIFASMYREIVDTGKTSAQFLHKRGLKFMKNIFWIAIYKLLIAFLLPALLGGVGVLFVNTALPVSIFMFVLAGLLMFAGIILVYFATFFSIPIITLEKGTSWQVFMKIVDYSKKNLLKVLTAWLVVLALSIAVGFAMFIITFPLSILSSILGSLKLPYLGMPISMVAGLLQTIVRIVLGFITSLFIFNVFFSGKAKTAAQPKKKVKKRK
ncbi:hypothetical protein KY311_03295 [Candidatus Woesearchaeota archaeon]|nr:hypothetical protein [Candidatus Woesearchaeota archaeon]